MNAEEYLQGAARRLHDDGSEVSWVAMSGGTALVGYQSKFRILWLATKVHLFTVLYPTEVATDTQLAALGQDAVSHANATKGRLRGLQSGVAVIPALIAQTVTEPARRPPPPARTGSSRCSSCPPSSTWAAGRRSATRARSSGERSTPPGCGLDCPPRCRRRRGNDIPAGLPC
jgi:hypothetical protein